jgi:hypothetical protein
MTTLNEGSISALHAVDLPQANRLMHAGAVREVINRLDENTLVGLVMALTGGWASPSVVQTRIREIKSGGR